MSIDEKIKGKLDIAKGYIRGEIEVVNPYANLYDVLLNVKNDDKTTRELKLRIKFNHHYNIPEEKFEPNANETLGPKGEVLYHEWDYQSLDYLFTPFSSDILIVSGKLDDKVEWEVRKRFNEIFNKNRQQWTKFKTTNQ